MQTRVLVDLSLIIYLCPRNVARGNGGKCETKKNQKRKKKTNLKTSLNYLEKIE